jgi:SAM-dependent methyltransferase
MERMFKRKKYFSQNRSEIREFICDQYNTVLEVGCGDGAFLENLKYGVEVWGIEPDPSSSMIASRKLYKVFNDKYHICPKRFLNKEL